MSTTVIRDSVISVSLKDKATAALKNMKAASDNLVKGLGGVEGVLKTIGELYVLKQIGSNIYGVYKSYAEEETTITRLNLVMKDGFKGLNTEIQKTANSLQNYYTPGELADFSKYMYNNKVSVDFLTKSIGLLSKASAVYGIDLNTLGANIATYTGKGTIGRKGFGIELLNKPEYAQQMKQLSGISGKIGILAREKLIYNILAKESNNLEKEWITLSKTGGIQISQLAKSWGELKQAIGGVFDPFINFIQPYLIKLIISITKLIDIMPKWLKFLSGGIILATLLAGAVVILSGAVIALSKALLVLLANPIVAIIVGVIAALVAVGLIIEDIYYWVNGGDSVIGDHLGTWDEWSKKAKTLIYWLDLIKTNYRDILKFLENPPEPASTYLIKKISTGLTGTPAYDYVRTSLPNGQADTVAMARDIVQNLTINYTADDKGTGETIARKIAEEAKKAMDKALRAAQQAAATQRKKG
jgi:hypothetical protein